MSVKLLSDYVGFEDAKILEEYGYHSKDDLMKARVIDLTLLGSFSVFSLERMIVAFYKEENPKSKIEIEDLFEETTEPVTVLGLSEYDDPTPELKGMTVKELCELKKLSARKIVTLLRIIRNGTISKKRLEEYSEIIDSHTTAFHGADWVWDDFY